MALKASNPIYDLNIKRANQFSTVCPFNIQTILKGYILNDLFI